MSNWDTGNRALPQMPNVPEQEAEVLGAVLTGGVSWWRQVVSSSGSDEALDLFWDANYRLVATVMSQLAEDSASGGDRITRAAMEDRLSRMPGSDSLGPNVKMFLLKLQTGSSIRDLKDLVNATIVLSEQRQLRNSLIEIERVKTNILAGDTHPNQVSDDLRKLSLAGGSTGVVSTFGELALEADNKQKAPWTIPTGITEIDDAINGGLEPGRLYVIGARPKVGKSTFVVNLIASALESGAVVVFASLEMSYVEVRSRIYACWSGVDQNKIYQLLLKKAGWEQFTNEEEQDVRDAMEEINGNTRFRYSQSRNTNDIINDALKTKTEYPEDTPIVLFVDYLQKLANGFNKNNEISDITNRFSMTALDTKMAVVVPSQINRSGAEDGMPQPHQLRDSGAIEQDLDVLFLLNRKHLQDKDEPAHIMDIWVALNRAGGEKWVNAFYAPDRTQISDLPDWNSLNSSPSYEPSNGGNSENDVVQSSSKRLVSMRSSAPDNYSDEDDDY